VTGAGAGIGRTGCFRFAWEGARVIAVDLDRTSVAKLADEIGESRVPQVADLSGRKQIDRIVAGCTKHFGGRRASEWPDAGQRQHIRVAGHSTEKHRPSTPHTASF
jgi:NAD(P)-dependent dehydrogenase (short-subunit alcohol dehydrogenase family)